MNQITIGGTDIAAILGLSPFKDAYQVWCEKMNISPSTEGSGATQWGTTLEPVIAAEYAKRNGVEVRSTGTTQVIHPARIWQSGRPDFLIFKGGRQIKKGLEVKTAGYRQSFRWGADGTDHIPDEYLMQCHWYMSLMDFDEWECAALIGGQDYREYYIKRNLELEGVILDAAEKFYKNHLLTGKAPSPGAKSEDWIKKRFPKNLQPIDRMNEHLIPVGCLLHTCEEEMEKIKSTYDRCKNIIRNACGLKDGLEGDGFRFTWKCNKDGSETDWQKVAIKCHENRSIMTDPLFNGIVASFTTKKPGPRVFRSWFDEGKMKELKDKYDRAIKGIAISSNSAPKLTGEGATTDSASPAGQDESGQGGAPGNAGSEP